jgi:intracellular sulfur oxidation DsrE/DsrF family protein
MKKSFFLLLFVLVITTTLCAQKEHRIVFDFTKNDTASFAVVIRHASNIKSLNSNSRYEIVCHGPGLDMLIAGKTTVANEIRELAEKYNVVFAACEATMKRRGIEKSQLVTQATTVPAATLEISSKQQEGWSYIKE